MQWDVVRKPLASPGQMIEGGGSAIRLGEQLSCGAVGVNRPRLGFEHALPELERARQVATHGR
jgi:hypothetical protein